VCRELDDAVSSEPEEWIHVLDEPSMSPLLGYAIAPESWPPQSTHASSDAPFGYAILAEFSFSNQSPQSPILEIEARPILVEEPLSPEFRVAKKSQFDRSPSLELFTDFDLLNPGWHVVEEPLVVIKPKKERNKRGRGGAGPNRFGRTGTRRCELCRHWRRKVCVSSTMANVSASMTSRISNFLVNSARKEAFCARVSRKNGAQEKKADWPERALYNLRKRVCLPYFAYLKFRTMSI